MILVTGATGFLGHNLVTYLLASGYPVRALVRETSDVRYLRDLGVELAVGDVCDVGSVNRAVVGCQYVVHGAGLFRFWGDPKAFERTNVEGTAWVLEAARRHNVEKVVHISTIAVVGNPPPGIVIDEATPCHPADAYQRSKLDGENLARMFQQGAHLLIVILRPGAFYGPWGHYAFNRLFFEDPLKGLRIQVHGGRRVTFPAFVPDVARAILAALKVGRPGEIYNVSGESLTHREANAVISRLAGIWPWRLNVPAAAMAALARAWTRLAERTGREPYYPINLAGYVFNDWRVSSAKARAELDFFPTSFEEGVRQTLEWYWNSGMFRRLRAASRRPAAHPSVASGK
ncbi:MAG: NAD-dependent epimerase/dehydratase family protein [Chloroflexi bacterium]|nr:NAD-dependent epimerase/dehydratase family protein [Chloroflexota bacterium]